MGLAARNLTNPGLFGAMFTPGPDFSPLAPRRGPKQTVLLEYGDALVVARSTRLAYHGVLAIRAGAHDMTGVNRISLTFRKAG